MRKRFLFCLHGRLLISVYSPFPHDFVNRCVQNGILLKNISSDGEKLICDISAYDLLRAKRLNLTRGFRIRILSRYGFIRNFLPLFLRPFLFIGIILSVAFIYFMSSFIWDIRILSEGADNRELLRYLEQLGVRPGVLKSSVDNEKIKNLVLLNNDELAWFAVNISGCRAQISYSLKRVTPELIAATDPCDVVSDSVAVIKSVDTYKGNCKVSPGDTVFPGDVIISSEIILKSNYSDDILTHYVHARGDVWGRTWYDLSAKTPRFALFKTYGGKIKRKVYLRTGKNRYNISIGYGNHSGNCDIIIREYALGFGAFLCVESYDYYSLECLLLPEKETERLNFDLESILLKSMDRGRIVAAVFNCDSGTECFTSKMSAECVEQIGVQKKYFTNTSGS